MISFLAHMLADLLEMDHIGTRVEGENTIYAFKTTSLCERLVEIKSKVLSMLDAPFDIPRNVDVKPVKKGLLLKEYIVEITVPSTRIGELSDLLATKYGFVRRRKYSGEL